jgi:NAD(P)-dependent dehydrogenase (short-subunit alcohol dehydrogenase family)
LKAQASKIEILVNNAGSTGVMAPLADTDFQKWWQAFVSIYSHCVLIYCIFLTDWKDPKWVTLMLAWP